MLARAKEKTKKACRVTWHHGDMRIFYPQELEALLLYNGFSIENKYGDFDKSPFTSTDRGKSLPMCAGLTDNCTVKGFNFDLNPRALLHAFVYDPF